MAFERVYTVDEYYDGPRSGIANYCGQPYHYASEWDDEGDNYVSTFVLTPISDEAVTFAVEQWDIWRAWELAYHRGEVAQSTHPASPGQNARNAELERIIKGFVENSSGPRRRARGTFRATPGQRSLPKGVMRDLEVEWIEVAE